MLNILFGLILFVSLIVVVVVTTFVFKKGIAPYISSRMQPVVTSKAVVLSKREETTETMRHNFERRFGDPIDPSDVLREEPIDWYATFKLNDGEEHEFHISQTIYEALIVGDSGDLAWRGRLFVRFTIPEVDSPPPKPDKTVPDDWL
jgi:hypothetical protein